MNHSMN